MLCFVLLNHGNEERIVNILKEIHRTLKPGASCLILETHPDSIGLKFSTFKSGSTNKVYDYGEARKAWLFLRSGKNLALAGHHWPKEMYYKALLTAGFQRLTEQAPVLKDIPENKLKGYMSINKEPKRGGEFLFT